MFSIKLLSANLHLWVPTSRDLVSAVEGSVGIGQVAVRSSHWEPTLGRALAVEPGLGKTCNSVCPCDCGIRAFGARKRLDSLCHLFGVSVLSQDLPMNRLTSCMILLPQFPKCWDHRCVCVKFLFTWSVLVPWNLRSVVYKLHM